jgi:hypothetical protein
VAAPQQGRGNMEGGNKYGFNLATILIILLLIFLIWCSCFRHYG